MQLSSSLPAIKQQYATPTTPTTDRKSIHGCYPSVFTKQIKFIKDQNKMIINNSKFVKNESPKHQYSQAYDIEYECQNQKIAVSPKRIVKSRMIQSTDLDNSLLRYTKPLESQLQKYRPKSPLPAYKSLFLNKNMFFEDNVLMKIERVKSKTDRIRYKYQKINGKELRI
ncbi:Hypothetical_protein [Hexamita inflata]|uniref:Hypothetical_protein n=1 Tax=Hexamita inflata TaxID=28002 RepID=A0AA86QH13_9EUKA|nr:Hypothetical protein HINF_LOCUS46821 [Hexamita inflata]